MLLRASFGLMHRSGDEAPQLGGLDQRFEHVEGDDLDAIAKREFVASREFLNG
jgi:hypothetical protein